MDKFGGSRLFYYFTAEYAALERCLNKTKTATMRLSTEAMVSISEGKPSCGWRKRSIPTHSEWLYPLTFDAGKGLKEA